ncbi:MAG: hypothetical protein EOO53_19795 [Gammaproteobacteria bacterium]|nr:MAG: hypothetical protein EOO53_19795 [Gammaproteobacteria bacterium]
MKYIQTVLQGKTNIVFITLLVIAIAFTSCASKLRFNTSSVVPAAEGTVKVKKDDNNNYNIKISLSNLAAPDRLQPSKKMYIVWMEADDQVNKNIGQINTSTGFLSGKLKADFETVSATKPIRIFITAEDDANVQYPDSRVVLSTNQF